MPKLGESALLRDKYNNEYSEEALLLAMLLKSKSKNRDKNKDAVGKLLDDPNQRPIKK